MELIMEENGFVTSVEYGELHISGESQYGFRPYQLMVASIAGCSAGVLRKVLTKMRLEFHDIKISTRVERNEEKANRIEKVHLHFVIQGASLRQDKVEKAIAVARKNCSMVQSVKDSIQVTESFKLA